jgi:hypothetical protein
VADVLPTGTERRWAAFDQAELFAIQDGLRNEAELDPLEDESFAARVEIAQRLIDEIDQYFEG